MDYVDHLTRAGAVPVLLPPPGATDVEELTDEVAAIVERLDGLVIAGGADIGAGRYGASSHPSSQDPRPDRDAWELALVRVARAAGLPLLGVCRGMQLMAVASGGALIQHLPDVVGTDVHCLAPGVFTGHTVDVLAGTVLAGILSEGLLNVPTYHHQAVATHPGYRVAARHTDGTIEAIEAIEASEPSDPSDPDRRDVFCLGVQWHPEAADDPRLFSALVRAATRRRSE